jgi:hypothetical protein
VPGCTQFSSETRSSASITSSRQITAPLPSACSAGAGRKKPVSTTSRPVSPSGSPIDWQTRSAPTGAPGSIVASASTGNTSPPSMAIPSSSGGDPGTRCTGGQGTTRSTFSSAST